MGDRVALGHQVSQDREELWVLEVCDVAELYVLTAEVAYLMPTTIESGPTRCST